MAAEFDILDDVSVKFTGTVVMYEKKAALVKGATYDPDKLNQFILQTALQGSRSTVNINLNDPDLDYKNYRIGYCNGGTYCSWWYRKPHKQWAQGLKSGQMGWRISADGGHAHDNFGFNKPFINMLEGIYPDIETVKKSLIDKSVMALAFHKDFALSYDQIHDDFVLEYHGTQIGASIDRELKQFKIMPEARHLMEALQEARSVHA